MKKILFILLILITFLLISGVASARDRYPYHHRHPYRSEIYISPPAIWIAPPVYYRPYYSPYRDYPPTPYGYRVWVPGYWEERWTPYGWEKVWVPGYWRYEY